MDNAPSRDQELFLKLWKILALDLHAFVRGQLRGELSAEVEDILQELSLVLWKIVQTRPEAIENALNNNCLDCDFLDATRRRLFGAASNMRNGALRRYYRRQKLNQGRSKHEACRTDPAADDPSTPMQQDERLKKMDKALSKLTPHESQVIHFREILRLSYAEISSRTGQKAATLRCIHFRALTKLRNLLDEGEIGDMR